MEENKNVTFNMNNMDFAKLTDVQLTDVNTYWYHVPMRYRKYTKEQVLKFMKDPERCYKQLREASIYLYAVSTQYRRVVNYFADMATLDYVMYPFKFDRSKVNTKAFANSYKKACDYLEIFNLKHEMRKILVTAWREDLFAGYIYQTKDSLYIRRLPPDFVKIASVVDGCYIVSFDFTYFDQWSNVNNKLETELESWGDEFREKYAIYCTDKINKRWQLLDEEKQFNIKISEDVPYPLIPLLGCLPGIYDIEDYKDLQKGAAVLRNYKALGLKIPTTDKGDFLIDKSIADQYYNQLANITPPNIGVFETPMDVVQFDFERSNAEDPDRTYEAIRNFYNDVGISALLFGSDKQTAASLNISIIADESLVFAVNRQIERNVNRLLKTVVKGVTKFQIKILDVSEFHKQQMHDMYLKDAQYGEPTKMATAATIGISQPTFSSIMFMENDFLNLHEEMIPLQSSYTQTSDDEGGRPTAEEEGEEVSDSNENTREHDSNASR